MDAPYPLGTLANRYEIEALIGRGGMGEVFRARDRVVGELVAVKVLTLNPRDPVVSLRRFRQAVRLARRVTHRNVARVFDLVEEADGRLLLTMELVSGGTLRELLDDVGRLPPDRVLSIGLQLSAGLTAAHAAGVVH